MYISDPRTHVLNDIKNLIKIFFIIIYVQNSFRPTAG